MAADEKTEREQYLKELARLKSLRSKQNDEKKDAADTAASHPAGVSWAVNALASSPACAAIARSCAGVSVPSE